MAQKPASKPASKPAARTAARPKVPMLEWAAAAIGLVLALTVIGVILTEALQGEDTPPALTVHASSIEAFDGGYTVEVEVKNAGSRTASAVVIEGELNGSEIAEATIDYVPARSAAKGGLVFRSDPRAGDLKLYAKGYVEP